MTQEPENKIYKVKILVSGFTKEQVTEGLQDLLDEFRVRPWLFETEAYFDETNNLLVVIVGYENDFRLEEGAIDEVSDCIIATLNFNEQISFNVSKI